MKISTLISTFVLVLFLGINCSSGRELSSFYELFAKRSINWNGNWAFACDFDGNDLTDAETRDEDCSEQCAQTPGCTHFIWTTYNGGTCWMKKGAVSKSDAVSTYDPFMLCGVVQESDVAYGVSSSLDKLREDIRSGNVPMQGVNLGGWLIAEYWMTKKSPAWQGVPENIANMGEYKTMQYLGHGRGDVQFQQHRDSYITEQDFRDISAAKMNTVRIPVGYWITGFDKSGGGDPNAWKVFAPNAINYLDRAIREWAPRNNIVVFISFHAAKGSQNGMDHSAPVDPGKSYWSGYPENVQNTLDAVEWLARRYNDNPAFLGIGLLNEPSGTTSESVLKKYYYDAYGRIRSFSNCLLSVSPLLYQQGPYDSDWNKFMPPPKFYNIRHEWHRYQIWGFEGWNKDQLLNYARNDLKKMINAWTGNWLFIGEWSIASSANFNDNDLRLYAQAQIDAFKGARGGWTFWTWKYYNDEGGRNAWSMKAMINQGFIRL